LGIHHQTLKFKIQNEIPQIGPLPEFAHAGADATVTALRIFKYQNVNLSLADWQFGLLVLATVLIAAAGYVINDIMDQDTDNDNKHKQVIVGRSVSESLAYNLYVG
jgi:4-hydroxybenzoate polyprenyltransferase